MASALISDPSAVATLIYRQDSQKCKAKVEFSAGYTKTHLLPPKVLPLRSKTITKKIWKRERFQGVKTCNLHQVKGKISDLKVVKVTDSIQICFRPA